MRFSVDSFKSMYGDLARGKNFLVKIPVILEDTEEGIQALTFLVQSTSLPGRSIDVGTIPVQGQDVKVGDKLSFSNWDVTIRLDENHLIRNGFLRWNNAVIDAVSAHHGHPSMYKANSTQVSQLNSTGEPVSTVVFSGLWPADIGEVSVGHDETGHQTCSISFAYDRWGLVGADGQITSYGDKNDIDIKIDAKYDSGKLGGKVNVKLKSLFGDVAIIFRKPVDTGDFGIDLGKMTRVKSSF